MKIENVRSWSLALFTAVGLAGYPLISFVPDALGINSRNITVPFRAAYLGAAFLLLLLAAMRHVPARVGKLGIPLAIFWTLYCYRLAADILLFPVPLGRPASEFVLYALGMCFVPMLALFAEQDELTSHRSHVLTVAFTALACFVGVYYNYDALGKQFTRLAANEYLNPITFGHMGASLIGLSMLYLMQRRRPAGIPAWAPYALIPLGLVCLVLAASRGPLVAMAVMLALTGVVGYRSGRRARVMVLLSGAALALPYAITAVSDRLGGALLTRFMATSDAIGNENDVRMRRWRDAWQQFLDHPGIGSSLSERNSMGYPHNLVIESFMAVGIVGGVAFVVLFVGALWVSMRLLSDEPAYAWMGMLLVQRAVGGMFSGALFSSAEFWYMVAAVSSAAVVTARRRSTAGARAAPLGPPGPVPRWRRPTGRAAAAAVGGTRP